MNTTIPRWILVSVIGLTVTASVIVLSESRRNPVAAGQSREFQQMLGGLGIGPAVDLSRCTLAFDPRLGPVCDSHFGPISGGEFVCPYHACSVFVDSPAVKVLLPWSEVTTDATVP